MEIGICDDSEMFRRKIRDEIAACGMEVAVYSYQSAAEMLDEAEKRAFKIVFLDIEMPETDGMSLAGRLKQRDKELLLIFVTDHSELVYESIHYQPFRFIRKERLKEELPEAILSAKRLLDERCQIYEFIAGKEHYHIPVKELLFVEIREHRAYLNLEKGYYIIRKTMKELEGELKLLDFVRVHAGYLVNMKRIQLIGKESVQLNTGREIPMSRNRKAEVKQRFMEYLGRY